MSIKTPLSMTSLLLSSLFISSCTMMSYGSRVQNAPSAPLLHPDTHRHPENQCTTSITHTHPNGINDHNHHYSCQSHGRSRGNVNTHTHPENNVTRSTQHTHPNGENEHEHYYHSY